MNKKIWILPILIIAMTFALTLVSAEITSPANESVVCGTINIIANTSGLGSSFGTNATNATFYYNEVLLGLGTPNADGTTFTYSWDTTANTATWNKTIRVQFQNSSATGFERVNESLYNIRTDNEGPVITFTSSNTGDGSKVKCSEFTIDISANESMNSATVTINKKTYALTLGSSATTASKTFSEGDLPDNWYTYTVSADDTTSCTNTGSNTRDVEIQGSKGAKSTYYAIQQQEQKTDNNNLIWAILMIVGFYFLFFRKRK